MTARMRRDPAAIYQDLTAAFGEPVYERIDAPATAEQKRVTTESLGRPGQNKNSRRREIDSVLTNAPGNGAAIGGLKVIAKDGWFAARPSGTESIYKIYAESFQGEDHLRRIQDEAQTIVSDAIS